MTTGGGTEDPFRAAVLGAGTMGTGIAQLLLQAGATVALVDPSEDAIRRARAGLIELFERLHAKGRLADEPAALLARLETGAEQELVRGAQWVLEAAPEDLALKRSLFAAAATIEPAARLATNTSTLSVTAIAAVCPDPSRVVGMHFFNPPGLMRLVEVVPGLLTEPAVTEAAVALARRLGREPVVAKDAPGFIVNRLARPFYLEALRLHADGVPVATVDAALRGTGFRMGPFELLDMIGLDVNLAASESVYRAFYEEPRFRPHPMQRVLVEAGLLGRKSGRGFYDHGEASGREQVGAGGRGATAGATTGPAAGMAAGTVAGTATGTAAGTAAGTDPRGGDAPPGSPTFHVLGDGSVARRLRTALPTTPEPAAASLVLDARLDAPPRSRGSARGEPPRAVLAWGRSAAVAGADLGFSIVPLPAGDPERLTIELMSAGSLPGDPPSPALERAMSDLAAAGANVVVLPDMPGGAAFRIVGRLFDEAFRALCEGLATASELDLAMRLGVNYPAGPLAWGQALGLKDVDTALRSLQAETADQRFAPHPRLANIVASGLSHLPRGVQEVPES